MKVVRFLAVIGEDEIIRLPAGTMIPGGEVEVTIRATGPSSSAEEEEIDSLRDLLLDLVAEAERIAPPLPSDLAVKHNHYAHGKSRS